VSETNLFAGTKGEGVWQRPLSEMITSVKELSNNLPTDFGLNQNYPNPFNPSTTIEFILSENGRVTLKIFDLLGREVETLIDGKRKAGIIYKEVFDASKLASGLYFYRLQTAKSLLIKKMMLVK
jgi:hypothetical protein